MIANIRKHSKKSKLAGKFLQADILGGNAGTQALINNMHKMQRTKPKRKK